MALLVCAASGNLTASTTWAVTAGANHFAGANTIALSATAATGSAFVPGGVTIDGIGIHIAAMASATATNSVIITLRDSTAGADKLVLTVPLADIPTGAAGVDTEVGWFFAKAAAPVALTAGNNHTISMRLNSAATAMSVYRDGTAGNFQRYLRTTSTSSPGAGDDMYILAEWTTTGTFNAFTVTMDSTSLTPDYGNGTAASSWQYTPAIGIGKLCKLQWGTAASTTYQIRLSGGLKIWNGGTLEMCTSGAPLDRSSTYILRFDPTNSTYPYGVILHEGGTWTCFGQSRTSGKNIVRATLTADVTNGTVIPIDQDTGWKNGDEIIIGASQRSAASIIRTMNADALSTSISLSSATGAGVTFHGTGNAKAHVGLISRNIYVDTVWTTVLGQTVLGPAFTGSPNTLVWQAAWTSFGNMPINTTTTARSLPTKPSLSYCSFRHGNVSQTPCYMGADANHSFTDLVIWLGTGHTVNTYSQSAAQVLGDGTFKNCLICSGTYNQGTGLYIGNTLTGPGSNADAFQNNWYHSLQNGMSFPVNTLYGWTASMISGSEIINCATGMTFSAGFIRDCEFANVKIMRGSVTGIHNGIVEGVNCTFSNIDIFGHATGCVFSGTAQALATTIYRNVRIGAEGTAFTDYAVNFNSTPTQIGYVDVKFQSCEFGTPAVVSTGDVRFAAATASTHVNIRQVTFDGCTFRSATRLVTGTTATLMPESFIAFQGVGTENRYLIPNRGSIMQNTTTYNTAPPSEEIQPVCLSGAFTTMESGSKRVAVESGTTVTMSVYVRKNTTYNGQAPLLKVRSNYSMGVVEAVLDTHTAAADVWEQLAGTTTTVTADGVLEFFVEVSGTAGSVFVDDWTVT